MCQTKIKQTALGFRNAIFENITDESSVLVFKRVRLNQTDREGFVLYQHTVNTANIFGNGVRDFTIITNSICDVKSAALVEK